MNPFSIDLRALPSDGQHLVGSHPASFFQLGAQDPLQPLSPLSYDLRVERDDGKLVVTGQLQTLFSLECGRCLQQFPYQVELSHYHAELPIEKQTTIDLTDCLREDILLALPNFPRCEDGNIEERVCPAEGRFDPASPETEDPPPGKGQKVWDALDQLK